MQGKEENVLSFDEWEIITSFLPARDVFNLSRTTKDNQSFFKPIFDEHKKINQFLQHVVRAEYDAIEKMLKDDPGLMLKRRFVIDEAGRTFEAISGLEYAIWAQARHTLDCMRDSLSIDTKNRLDVLKQALDQYDKVATQGITYTFNKIQVTGEKHFDMENTIIKELQTQDDSINAPGSKDWIAINIQWREGVGGAQKIFTSDLVDYYCSDVPFYPVPDFTSRPQSKRQFYNYCNDGELESWFSVNSKLGIDFGIYKGGKPGWQRAGVPTIRWLWSAIDLPAMKALCKVKTECVSSFRTQLKNLMNVDKQSQVFQKM